MKKFISQLLKGALLGLYVASPFAFTSAQADDTEVYFLDGALVNTPKPKIIIAIDFSSAGNGGKILDNFIAAMKAIANDPTVTETVDLGFAVMGNGPVIPIVYPAKPIVNEPPFEPTFEQVVSSINRDQLISGSTPTVQGMVEVSRYFLGRTPVYANFDDSTIPLTHPKAKLANGNYIGSTDPSCANAMIVIGTGQDNSTSWKDVDQIVPQSYCQGNECNGAHLTRYMRELNNTVTYAVDAGANGKNAARLDDWAFNGGTESAIDYDPSTDTTDCTQETGLCKIIKDIADEVAAQGSSFVQAGVTVSQQNRLNHDNHLYFAQFQADNIKRWPGNLKKYKVESGEIQDQDNTTAVDPNTGLFLEKRNEFGEIIGATSYWKKEIDGLLVKVPDGNQVEIGGAMEQLDSFLKTKPYTASDGTVYQEFDSYSRRLFTTDSTSKIVPFSDSYPAESDYAFNGTDIEFKQLKARTLGYNLRYTPTGDTEPVYDSTGLIIVGEEPKIAEVATPARLMGDPLHSVPKVVQYSSVTEANNVTLAYIGTNLGYLHAIDIDTGKELWSYLPYEMLKDMDTYLSNEPLGGDPTAHNYGLDGEIHIVHADTNGNLKVDDDETALLIVGMRRGGDKYFVLDISDPTKPELRFTIDSTKNGFNTLGQTWSMPTVTNIDWYDKQTETVITKTVMIFGGGYDEVVDGIFDKDKDGNYINSTINITKGKDVFIYDLNAQENQAPLLWQASSITDISLSSVPATVRAISLNNDSTVDHLYVADVNGKVFRFDLVPDELNGGFSVNHGVIFDANSGALNEREKRRFYYAPSVAFIPRPNGNSFVSVALGSGYRAHPLNIDIQDYFFMIRDTGVLKETKTFGKNSQAITISDLSDVTSRESPDRSVEIVAEQEVENGNPGWFIKLEGLVTGDNDHEGEKIISEARILFGKIVFTSYIPNYDLGGTVCSPVIGKGKLYGVNLIDGTTFFGNDRAAGLISDGIPPMFQLLYTSGGSSTSSDAAFIGLVGNEVIDDAFTEALTKGYDGVIRVNWRKKPDDE